MNIFDTGISQYPYIEATEIPTISVPVDAISGISYESPAHFLEDNCPLKLQLPDGLSTKLPVDFLLKTAAEEISRLGIENLVAVTRTPEEAHAALLSNPDLQLVLLAPEGELKEKVVELRNDFIREEMPLIRRVRYGLFSALTVWVSNIKRLLAGRLVRSLPKNLSKKIDHSIRLFSKSHHSSAHAGLHRESKLATREDEADLHLDFTEDGFTMLMTVFGLKGAQYLIADSNLKGFRRGYRLKNAPLDQRYISNWNCNLALDSNTKFFEMPVGWLGIHLSLIHI